MTFELAYIDCQDLDLWDDPEEFQEEPLLEVEELEARWAIPAVRAGWAAGDWWLDWREVSQLWHAGAYFVLLVAQGRFWCLPEPVLRDITVGLGDDPWVTLDAHGLLFARGGYAVLGAFQERSPRQVMEFLASTVTRKGERRKRGPEWGWFSD